MRIAFKLLILISVFVTCLSTIGQAIAVAIVSQASVGAPQTVAQQPQSGVPTSLEFQTQHTKKQPQPHIQNQFNSPAKHNHNHNIVQTTLVTQADNPANSEPDSEKQFPEQQGEIARVRESDDAVEALNKEQPEIPDVLLETDTNQQNLVEKAEQGFALLEEKLAELQRGLFKDALDALAVGKLDTFKELASKNQDYVLYPYLEYHELAARISEARDEEVLAFVQKYKHLNLASRIKATWLNEIIDQQRWDTFVRNDAGYGGDRMQCARLYASYLSDKSKKNIDAVLREFEKIWLKATKYSTICDPLLAMYEKSKFLTIAKRWEKIELSVKQGDARQAIELAKPFNTRDRGYVELWTKIHSDPAKYFNDKSLRKNTLMNRKIVLHGMQRLARRNAQTTKELWHKINRRYGFTDEERGEMLREIALRSAYQQHPKALDWLNHVPKKFVNADVKYWRAMSALREQNWKQLAKAINQLEEKEQQDSQWQYWLARAMEQLGDKKEALLLFEKVSRETNYYGFMSSDRLGIPYTFNFEPLQRDQKVIQEISAKPSTIRAKELYLVGQISDARREWNNSIRKLDEAKLLQAAILVHSWGWHDNAIVTIAKTSHRNDYNVRFPLAFQDIVINNAQTHGVDPSLILGVARRESAFRPDARSSVGALGLMQLMPGTARMESKRLGLDKPSTNEILDTGRNVLLGSSYLNRMLERFGGNQALATAAYNAGPRRVDAWLPESDGIDVDIWVDTIPFRETREYVRAVMAYSTIFNWKMDEEKVTLLKSRMYSVISRDGATTLNSMN